MQRHRKGSIKKKIMLFISSVVSKTDNDEFEDLKKKTTTAREKSQLGCFSACSLSMFSQTGRDSG